MEFPEKKVAIQPIVDESVIQNGVELYLLREDQIHPEISGNKWRKLKYNVLTAKAKKSGYLLTFGGAYSNHIAATAAAGKELGIKTIGIIRGEEVLPLNPTLTKAKANGMTLHYLSREMYREKHTEEVKAYLQTQFSNYHSIPEGGANYYGVNGCMEILNGLDLDFDYVSVACGTGTTLAGMALSLKPHQKIIGFPALKGGGGLLVDIRRMINEVLMDDIEVESILSQLEFITEYHFGGYAKLKPELISFIQQFKIQHGIQLDGVYTGKMMFGLFDKIKSGFFPKGSKILAVHTGGIQGNEGLEKRYKVRL